MVSRKQSFRIESYSRNIYRLPLLCREVLPKQINEWIRVAFFQENGDHCQVTFGIRVNQVDDHIVVVAIHVLLARMMKMKLLQRVELLPHRQSAARRVIHLNGVTIIDDVERNGIVVELESRQLGLSGTPDIDGRLRFAT